jgi:hypothetical protein
MGMLRPIHRSVRWMAGGLVLSLLALGCATPMPVATAPALAPAAAPADATGVLTGQASLPEEMVDANQVIPTGIGRVIPTGQGRYRVQQAAAPAGELPVTGARVTLRDVTTRQPLAGIAAVRTDARGAFAIPGVPAATNVLIEVSFTLPGQKTEYHLLSVGRAAAGAEPGAGAVAVTWRSTAVVTRALSAPGTLDLLTVSPEALHAAELAEAERLAALNPAQRQATLTETLAGTLLGTLLPTPAPTATPAQSSSPAPVSVPSVIGAIASPLPGLLTPVTGVVSDTTTAAANTVETTVGTVTEPVAGAVTTTTETVVAPVVGAVTDTTSTVVGNTLGLLPAATATPTPTPQPTTTPTPAPTATPLITLPGLGGIGL